MVEPAYNMYIALNFALIIFGFKIYENAITIMYITFLSALQTSMMFIHREDEAFMVKATGTRVYDYVSDKK